MKYLELINETSYMFLEYRKYNILRQLYFVCGLEVFGGQRGAGGLV